MKKTTIFFSLIVTCLILINCKKEMGNYDEFYITNSSSHKVEYRVIGFNPKFETFQDSISTFQSNESKFYFIDSRGKGSGERKEDRSISPAPFLADSVIVCYDDTVCITHKLISGIPPINNILDSKSWTTKSLGDYQSQHTFTFTDTDYQEAYDNR